MDEQTARFAFLGSIGLSTLCGAASLWLGLGGRRDGAALFLLLAVLSLVATGWFRRVYHGLRRIRWQQELLRSQARLDDLLRPTPAALSDPPGAPGEAPGPPANDTHAP
jgi:hypothetical protein